VTDGQCLVAVIHNAVSERLFAFKGCADARPYWAAIVHVWRPLDRDQLSCILTTFQTSIWTFEISFVGAFSLIIIGSYVGAIAFAHASSSAVTSRRTGRPVAHVLAVVSRRPRRADARLSVLSST